MPLPLPHLLPLIFGGASVVAVLTTLVGLGGWVTDTAIVLALLTAAGWAVLRVRRPVARWALAAGIVGLAAASVVGWVVVDEVTFGVTRADVGTLLRQRAEADYRGPLLLLLATLALTLGVVALPRFRRPVWLSVVACPVALVPVAVVAFDAAGDRAADDPAALLLHVGPALVATVLAGLALVLAVSRADRLFLLPAGALLLQLTAAYRTWNASGSWTLDRLFRGVEARSAFLEPGLRMETSSSATAAVPVDLNATLATAALLLAAGLLAAGAARTDSVSPAAQA